MQDNSDINALIDDLKKNVLKNQHDDFVSYVKLFIQKENWCNVDKIQKFINGRKNTFSDDKDGKVLFGVLKFFLDTAVFQNRDIRIDDVYNLLDKFKDKLSWEQSCDLLMDFLDKDWDKDPNNKNVENARKLIDESLAYLPKLKAKKVYTSKFSCVQKYFKKIMDSVPGIKTPENLSDISKKLSETNFPPQFCFEIVWLFGDELLLETDIKSLGWHAQFARFRLEIAKMVEQRYPRQQYPRIYQTASGSEMNFTACITNCFNYMDHFFRCSDLDIKPKMSNIILEYLNNKDVSWKTKFSVINYIPFDDYYEFILKSEKWEEGVPYNNLLEWKSALCKKFSSPNDLLNNYAETFPQVKDDYEFDRQNAYDRRKNGCYVLCFVYSKKEIYECIKNLENKNDDVWKPRFLWQATTKCKKNQKNQPKSQFSITDFFKTPGEFLDSCLKINPKIGKFDAELIEDISSCINLYDLFLYPIDEIKHFIENTNDPNKLVLLFYTIFDEYGDHFKNISPLDILDIYIKLYPKIKDHLKDTDKKVYKGLRQNFKAKQLATALKNTDDPKKMILLLNTLNLDYCRIEDIKEMFNNPKDLFDACVGKYKSKDKNIEINEANCKCPQPLLNILKKYDKQELDRFTQYFKEENDPLTKSWLSDLVDVKQNFFETYSNVLDFLNRNKNCPKCVKNSLNDIIKNKFKAGFSVNDFLWLLGLESSYYCHDIHHNNLIYWPENLIEKRYRLISNLFLNSDQHGRTVISSFISNALKYHEKIWKAVLGLIIYCDEESKDIKSISLWSNLEILCNISGDYNLRKSRYNQVVLQIQNLTLQINQILTLNWKWFTIVGTLVYLWQLYSLNKRRSHLTAEKNRLQPFVDRLRSSETKIKLFGLQIDNRNKNKPTPFQYYEKYQARVKELLTDMQEAINHPEKEKMPIINENDGKNGPSLNEISTIKDSQENKI